MAVPALAAARKLRRMQRDDALALVDRPLDELCAEARASAPGRAGMLVTYSPKVFIPLTKLCRDVCHYCTFARPPRRGERAYLTRGGGARDRPRRRAAGCREALFTLGDKPELRYRAAREELAALGCATTLEYLGRAARGSCSTRPACSRTSTRACSRDDDLARCARSRRRWA